MKKLFTYFVLMLAFSFQLNAQHFTGVISLETENFEIGEKSTITCYLKFPYCKMEINAVSKEGSSSYTLYFNDQNSDMIMVAAGTKTIVPLASIPPNKYLSNILIALPTGKTESIAGQNCTEINLKSTNASIQCYVASNLEILFPAMLSNAGILKSLKENGIQGTPMTLMVKDLAGKNVFSQKVISLNSQELNESIFITN